MRLVNDFDCGQQAEVVFSLAICKKEISVSTGFEPARVAPKDTSDAKIDIAGPVARSPQSEFESFSLTTRTRHHRV